jgi:hypothetical protein
MGLKRLAQNLAAQKIQLKVDLRRGTGFHPAEFYLCNFTLIISYLNHLHTATFQIGFSFPSVPMSALK